jgi:putative transposase
MSKKRHRHKPEQIISKLRDADVMLNTGKDLSVVLQTLEICEATAPSFADWARRMCQKA